MKLFLDTSCLLAACGSATGASRAVFDLAPSNKWALVTSRYCIAEVLANLGKLGSASFTAWRTIIHPALRIEDDALTAHRPLAFTKAKDKPVLLTALAARCDFLLTLDRRDFGPFIGHRVYALRIDLPAGFLGAMREGGTLSE